jgi:hypothetical protein
MASTVGVSVLLAVFILLYICLAVFFVSASKWLELTVALGLAACTIPAIAGLYANIGGSVYSFQDYAVQVYLPIFIGLILLFTLYRVILPDSIESFLIILGSVSILFSTSAFSYILLRMKYTGT